MRVIRDRRGVSNVIVFVLGLVIIVTIVVNVFLWNYEMNQLDWERMREEVEVVDVSQKGRVSTCFTFKNKGALTTHLVSLWIIDSTIHRRYDIDLIINSGETLSYVRSDIHLPKGQYMVKVVTERGNIAIYSND